MSDIIESANARHRCGIKENEVKKNLSIDHVHLPRSNIYTYQGFSLFFLLLFFFCLFAICIALVREQEYLALKKFTKKNRYFKFRLSKQMYKLNFFVLICF